MARLVAWEPFREITALHNEMSRLMNSIAAEGNGKSTQGWLPPVDVWETETEIVYAFDLPGVPEDKVAVEVEDGALIVTGERTRSQEVKGENFFRSERRHGTFSRSLALPQGVREEEIAARFEDGVLEVHVRKPQAPQPRRIRIATGAEQQPTLEGTAAETQG